MIMPYVEIQADATGPYLLLVHGFLSSRAQWRANLAGLQKFCRPVIVELWGHGRSPAPLQPESYRADSYVDIFESIRQSLGIEHWMICGQSFGAGLTIRYALKHPDRVMGQVFTNSISALSRPDTMNNERKRADHASALEMGGIAAIEALPFHPRLAQRFAPEIKREMVEDAAKISPVGIANAIRFTSPELSIIDRFADIEVPTLLINGTWEKAFQPLRKRAAEILPALQVEDIEGGHSINVEAPAHFNDALCRFAKDINA